MKKFVYPVANGGAAWTNDSLVGYFQEEQYKAIEAIIKGLTNHWNGTQQAIILSGCEVTNIGGSNYSIGAGIVWINGNIIQSAAIASTTLPAYIIENTPIDLSSTDVTDATFQDATNPTLAVLRSTYVDITVPGSGEYITIDNVAFGNTYRLENLIGTRTGKYTLTVTKSGSTSPTVVGAPTISAATLRSQGLIADSLPITGSVSALYPNKKVEPIDFHIQVWGKIPGFIDVWYPFPQMPYGLTTINHFSCNASNAGAINVQIYSDSSFNDCDFRIVIIG